MSSVGDVFEIKVEQTLMGQQVLNIFFYEQRLPFITTDPTSAQTVAERFADQVIPEMQDVTQAELFYDRLNVRNLFDDADAFTLVLGVTGDGGTGNDVLPNFNAVSIELVGVTSATRRGAKRIAGLNELNITDGVISDPTALTGLAELGDAFVAPLLVGEIIGDPVFLPCVVKRVRSGVPGAYIYRLPTTPAESITNLIIDALVDLVITSQVSRKIGVGS